MDTNNIKLSFQVETQRIIEILSNEIYDSPLALLRENLQNAYDAVLMRITAEGNEAFNPKIEIEIKNNYITIRDNGIGMNINVLRENFWKAGSSGKRDNEIAQKAGVIGTFGIGAMANFGVCKSLEVKTSSISSDFTYISKAVRESLKIGEDCIDTKRSPFDGVVGSEIKAYLDENISISEEDSINYLRPYVKYVKIPVFINSKLISQNKPSVNYESQISNAKYEFSEQNILSNGFKYDLKGFVLSNSLVHVMIDEIQFQNKDLRGEIVLSQNQTNIMCYRNYFGLSSIPVSRNYNLGGYINLPFLTPTAGREALNRESISILNNIIASIEQRISINLSNSEISNFNTSFQRYIVNHRLLDLGKNLTIRTTPLNKDVKLNEINKVNPNKTKSYYLGNNKESLNIFANENNDLFLPSPSNPRRKIQIHFLNKLGIKQQNDDVQILKIYKKGELSLAEITILFKIVTVLSDDYLLKEVDVIFCNISHRVTSLVKRENNKIIILISKDSSSLEQLKHFHQVDYSILSGFVKDYVRTELYQKIAPYIPSATKQGADVLHKILLKNRELFKIEAEEQGELNSLISDYLNGTASFTDVIRRSSSVSRSHKQTLKANQIGKIEDAIPDLINTSFIQSQNINGAEHEAIPPILRINQETSLKLLKIDKSLDQLNNFKLFLSISDRLFRRDKDFFFEPHTTKIIWGNHRVVFIFSHYSNRITLYYDVELKSKIEDAKIGGQQFKTTTIITKNKIFIPIPDELRDNFSVDGLQSNREFYIRYDLITDLS